ncbi:uncharacterized protein BCR38DRAFT_422336 [Pseudomassariella vexata]|uniref:Uncharacterized protein n=1 Tax=Pseudomassariella vexata TaxID=1141098 RepID=A0A1Y2E9C4_9PEZI|nr:uncharacterized protein BCR38DRAFT_422336 [Pseudomassariella vexata]ORY68171.1 hypothetical protein BCR38DRAFT_422336 [Pseudomassariella vexata]
MMQYFLIFVWAVASLHASTPFAVNAQPARSGSTNTNILIPGKGLPSVRSLSLTVDDVFNPNFRTYSHVTNANSTSFLANPRPSCSKNIVADLQGVMSCKNYLHAAMRHACPALSTGTILCVAKAAGAASKVIIRGTSLCHHVDPSSCADVEIAIGSIMHECKGTADSHSLVAGGGATRNKGCMQIEVIGESP